MERIIKKLQISGDKRKRECKEFVAPIVANKRAAIPPKCAKRKRDNTDAPTPLLKRLNVDKSQPIHPLIHACILNRLDDIDAILEHESEAVNVTENTGRTPLMFAIMLGRPRIVERLLEVKCIDITMVDNHSNMAFDYAHYCVDKKQYRSCRRMLVLALMLDYIENKDKTFMIF